MDEKSKEKLVGFREVYNFEHHSTQEGEFTFGPYRFHITREHLDTDFAHTEGLRFGSEFSSSGFKHHVTETPANKGSWKVTALVAEHERLAEPSVLMPGDPLLKGDFDLSLILSFLTGRHVRIGKDSEPYLPVTSGYAITQKHFFRLFARLDWDSLPNVKSAGGAEAMEAVVIAMTNSNAGVKIAMGSAALDGLISRWHRKHGTSLYTGDVREKVSAAAYKIADCLKNEGVSDELISDIIPRLSNLLNDSALSKLKAFLIAHEIYPKEEAKGALSRLKWFNVMRNAIAHSGAVRMDQGGSPQASIRIAGAVAVMLLDISRVYVAKYLLKISDPGISQTQKRLMTFFIEGKFNGQDILNEDYDAFRRRLIEEYEVDGNLGT
ncbi:hypothetical protein V2I68_02100 [Pseudomonas viridiflava]|uniref:Apea-like HEPN domain-containing protein n=1 Tax=Pseudomonas viridiflava TaxID=33069 RepID=A0ABU7N1P4_PSEVI|nr:hypothetical protein [Pseudomonas viridiflava]MEE4038845.1 hypothetical protein [Pseudomonas viridiflava]MEE4059061.1 hypothetical protein [Pseudomonas viridiflava]MEE4167928.1 hypothetical protein [Pseudomonas viridiflava]